MYRAVIFDFFGVFCPDITLEWFKQTVPSYESKLADFQAICTKSDYGKISKQDFFTEVSVLAGVSVGAMMSGVGAQTIISYNLVDYVRHRIKKEFKTACLSNGTHEWTLHVITEHGLGDLFDVIVLSGDLGIVKPDPEIYNATLRKLNVDASEAIFIDDRQPNVDAGNSLGIRSLLFKNVASLKTEFDQLATSAK